MSAPTPIVATMFATLAAEMADPDRFRRGRAYVRQQAVMDVAIAAGRATGSVQGSRSAPYEVVVTVRPVRNSAAAAAKAGRLNALVPRPDDLTISCTCPDWGDPCKHGVAVLLALGEELARDPDRLAVWRRTDAPMVDEPAPATPVADDDPLADWLGHGYDPPTTAPLPPLRTRLRVVDSHDPTVELVLGAVDDAIATLARAFGHRAR